MMNNTTKSEVATPQFPQQITLGKKPDHEVIPVTNSGTNRRLATEKHPTIEAITNGLFRFEKKAQALARLETIKSHFIISSKLPKDTDENTLKLWIRGYDITEDEQKQGYLGNYAAIKVIELDGKFTLNAEKQRIALKYHPQRKRPRGKHPDWGHPALRIVKKGLAFDNLEDAQKILNQLHEEYPEVSIPNPNKLYIIIYSKGKEATSSPIQKFILQIKNARDGGFFIEYRANKYEKKTAGTAATAKTTGAASAGKQTTTAEAPENRTKGYFTSMVELKKASKKRKTPVRKPKPETDSAT